MTFDYSDILDDTADRSPDRVGLLAGDWKITYAEIQSAADTLAATLYARGVRPGDRVALCLGNQPEWVFVFFALCRLRASAVMLPSAWRAAEIRHAFELTGPRAIVASRTVAPIFDEVARPELAVVAGPGDAIDGWSEIADLLSEVAPAVPAGVRGLDPGDMELALPFSSGTTGMPKAVRHTHHSLVVATRQWRESLDITREDRLQALTPLAHILGIVNIGATFIGEATIRLFPRFTPRSMVESFQQDRITIGMTVAPIAAALAAMPDLEEFDLSSLRYLNWSATPVNRDIAQQVSDRIGVSWLPAYGTTEVPIVAVNPVSSLPHGRLDSVGLPPSAVDVETIDVVSHEFLPRGSTGEIVVRSPARMEGYLPEGDSPFLDGGWYRTGDIGHVEPEGWVVVTDRVKDIIRVSGTQVSPVEVERVLVSSPLVADCAVFGVPDERRGERPAAAVVVADGVDTSAEEIITWMADRLAPYKQLRDVYFVEEIPRTPSGKIQRRHLVGQLSAGAEK
ncbi:class I adenylate-forming enzyme family protein [Mumia sp. Pv 4-285]|uniref:class I adenylate-forming enzyme family protein n=1 Tax=Mumia qirimensis TaxID=3234852 RepID=UPI00351D37A6